MIIVYATQRVFERAYEAIGTIMVRDSGYQLCATCAFILAPSSTLSTATITLSIVTDEAVLQQTSPLYEVFPSSCVSRC